MDDDLLKRTRAFWEPRYGRKLSDEEAREIVENVVGFFRILEEWNARDGGSKEQPGALPGDATVGSPQRTHLELTPAGQAERSV